MENNESLFQTGKSFDTFSRPSERTPSSGCRIPFEQVLAGVSSEVRETVLTDLIALDIELRCAVGDTPVSIEYRLRFPADPDKVSSAFERALGGARQRRRGTAKEPAGPDGESSQAESVAAGTKRPPTPRAQWFGRFQLLEPIGSGGFGTVYRAHDPILKREVAVKVPREGRLNSQEVAALLREARAAARLKHPAIVQVYDAGLESEQVYVACELIHGPSLRQRLAQGSFSPDQAAGICRRIAEALQHAHELKIVHRDVNPSNILLDAEENPYLADFGLARDEAEEVHERELCFAGTLAYMSPEQLSGVAEAVTAASDIYSLGVVLFEMLTGRCPFTGTAGELLRQIRETAPPHPRQLNPAVPPDLEAIGLKCLARDPARRYASAAELADDLRRYLANEPVRARPASLLGRWWRWSRREPALATSLAVLALVVIAATCAIGVSNWKAVRSLHAAETNLYFHQVSTAQQQWLSNSPAEARESLTSCPAWMRDYEWWHLHGLFRTPTLLLRGAGDSFAFSPDGQRIVSTGGRQAALMHWDARSGNGLLCLPTKDFGEEWPQCVDFAPDGRTAVSGSARDGAVRLWDVQEGTFLRVVGRHRRDVEEVHFVGDGSRILSVGRDECLKLWETATGEELQTIRLRPQRIRAIALSPIEPRVVVSTAYSGGGQVSVWNYETGEKLEDLPFHATAITGLAFSPDGRLLAVAQPRNVLQIWQLTPWLHVQTMTGPLAEYACPTFDPSGQRIAAEGWDGSVHLWDIASGRQLRSYRGQKSPVGHLAFSPDGNHLAAGSPNSELRIWDTRTDQGAVALSGGASAVLDVQISPQGDLLAAAFKDGLVRAWRLSDGQPLWSAEASRQSSPVWAVAFAPYGRRLVCAGEDGAVWILDSADGRLRRRLAGDDHPLRCVVFSPDGQQLAAAGLGGTVSIYEADSGAVRQRLALKTISIRCLAFHPDGTKLAAGTRDSLAVVWDLASGRELWSRIDGRVRVWSVAWSPDGRHLAVGRGDGFVRLHQASDGTVACVFGAPSHDLPIDLAFSPNGRRLATATEQTGVTLWEIPTGREVLRLSSSTGTSAAVAFRPDGQCLATADRDGAVTLWPGKRTTAPGGQQLFPPPVQSAGQLAD